MIVRLVLITCVCTVLIHVFPIHSTMQNIGSGYEWPAVASTESSVTQSNGNADECVIDGRVLDWQCLENELQQAAPISLEEGHNIANIQEELLKVSPSMRSVITNANASQLLQMVGQHSKGRTYVPIVAVAALQEHDVDLFYQSVLKLWIEFDISDDLSQSSWSTLLIEPLDAIAGTDGCAEMVISFLQHRDSERIAWKLGWIVGRLGIHSGLDEWIQRGEYHELSLDYVASIALYVKESRENEGLEPLKQIEVIVQMLDESPGRPRFVYAMVSDHDDKKRIAKSVSESVQYLDHRRDSIPMADVYMRQLIMSRIEVVNDHIDIESMNVSDRTRSELGELLEFLQRQDVR